jgi:hypothetical protein
MAAWRSVNLLFLHSTISNKQSCIIKRLVVDGHSCAYPSFITFTVTPSCFKVSADRSAKILQWFAKLLNKLRNFLGISICYYPYYCIYSNYSWIFQYGLNTVTIRISFSYVGHYVIFRSSTLSSVSLALIHSFPYLLNVKTLFLVLPL